LISTLDPLGFFQALALLVGQNGSTFRQALEALVITSAGAVGGSVKTYQLQEDLPSFHHPEMGDMYKYIILISKS